MHCFRWWDTTLTSSSFYDDELNNHRQCSTLRWFVSDWISKHYLDAQKFESKSKE